jgi:peroxiredoxin
VKRLASSIVFLSFLLLCGCNSNRPPKIGEKAPDFTLADSSRSVSLSQLRGKPVLLNFWATWCPPCIQEMPSLVQLQKQMGDKVTILAVSEDADENAYKQFIRDHNIDLLTVRDPKNTANTLYGTFKFPETYVIDKDGVIRRKFIGAADWTSQEIVDYLNRL